MNEQIKTIESKLFQLNYRKFKYILIIEYKEDKRIYFYLIQDGENMNEIHINNFDLKTIKNILDLRKGYEDIKSVFDYLVDLLNKKKISIEKEFGIRLTFRKDDKDAGDSEYIISLKKQKIERDLILKKFYPAQPKEKIINNPLINEIKLESEKKNINIDLKENGDLTSFNENPEALKYDYFLAKNVSTSDDELNSFDVFKGVKDNIYYLIYSTTKNNNINILNIFTKEIVKSLSGHHSRVSVIKYYFNKVDKEYILSCDINSKAIIWDMRKDYQIKYILRMADKGVIKDAMILFGYLGKNYLIISRHNSTEFTKVYELADDATFIRDINKSNNNITNQMILWKYNNKNYLIELCKGNISIKNIFEKENYNKLKLKDTDIYISGFLYKNNQLIVNNSYDRNVLFVDLISTEIKKLIKYPKTGYSLSYWNDKYAIVVGDNIEIIDLETQEKTNTLNYTYVMQGVKKVKNNLLGEAIVVSDDKQNLILFSVYNK